MSEKKDNIKQETNENKMSNFDFVKSLDHMKLATFMGFQINKFLESQDLSLDEESLNVIIETYYNWLFEKCNMSIDEI